MDQDNLTGSRAILRDPAVCTAVIGVRTPEQLLENLKLDTAFSTEEDEAIARACADVDVNLWKPPAPPTG